MCIALAVALNTAMEMLSRRSVWEGVQFLALHPVHFLCNILVVLLTLLLALLVKRRVFMLSLVSTIWLGLAIANFILLGYRTTPLAAIDFYILKPVFSILKIYLTPVQTILIVLAFAAVITGIVFIFIKAPKHQALYRGALVSIAMTSLATFGLIHFPFRPTQLLPVLLIWPTLTVITALLTVLPPVCWTPASANRKITLPRRWSA